jgi:hypothetical protein
MPQKDIRMVYAIAPGVMTLKSCIFAWPGLGAGRDPGARKAADGAWKICRPTCSKGDILRHQLYQDLLPGETHDAIVQSPCHADHTFQPHT